MRLKNLNYIPREQNIQSNHFAEYIVAEYIVANRVVVQTSRSLSDVLKYIQSKVHVEEEMKSHRAVGGVTRLNRVAKVTSRGFVTHIQRFRDFVTHHETERRIGHVTIAPS